ncbi:MAG TPA: SGNH/GDSL hydrolase family protein [Candidatus Borkfalkia avistercoris]|uniref:SGNH/GDSL hydrolase family protein n=1 Tax=Candidatus Borkfalkia avistercoris TaxID=2838504 RepID=A0A9D2IF15_9FIRM|nr:SGNH/GDSL hydrolase family protein [Candidatus Borkfalkia avistercoris]
MDIRQIDKNFLQDGRFDAEKIKFYDVTEKPFALYGVFYDEGRGCFLRMPAETAAAVSEGVAALTANTAGGRVRFSTDSEQIVLYVRYRDLCRMSHMPLSGSGGFSLCENTPGGEKFICTVRPEWTDEKGFVRSAALAGGMRDYTLYFPLYNEVCELALGFDRSASVRGGLAYRDVKPILYYGSSITQGGCASRPDHAYQALISKKNNVDFINLGFSGNALGERTMARYLAGIACSVAVIDYDHNAPDAQHLAATHGELFRIFRETQPDVPVVFITKPDPERDAEGGERREIIRETYRKAVAEGDKNVLFIDGSGLFGDLHEECTVDGCHPNDLGFYRMSEVIGKAVDAALKI